MAKYSVLMQRTGSTTASVGTVNCPAALMRRIAIYDVIFGSEGVPADNPFLWQMGRTTTAGTTTAVTPQPIDPADPAAVSAAGTTATVEPTYTAGAILLNVPLNQRATFRWVAPPGGELIVPATASNGVGVKTPTASAVAISSQVLFEER